MGFTKLDEKILQSSIMAEDTTTFKVWITLLAACERNGIAYVSPVYLSSICHLPLRRIHFALEKLEGPDKYSRSLAEDGRRVRRVDGGYEIINYLAYRDISLKDAEAERKRLYREERKACPDKSGRSPDASASASSSASVINIVFQEGEWGGITIDQIAKWHEAYPACDIKIELAKMREWLMADWPARKKVKWKAFIVRWLAKGQDRGGTKGGGGGQPGKRWLDTTKVEE